jgi:hypothetical protein
VAFVALAMAAAFLPGYAAEVLGLSAIVGIAALSWTLRGAREDGGNARG